MRKTDRKKTSNNKSTIKKYFITKTWDTRFKGNTFSVDEVTHRLENNLPLDDLFDKLDSRYNRKNDGKEDL